MMITDGNTRMLEIQIENLERENRELKETLLDRFYCAALPVAYAYVKDSGDVAEGADHCVAIALEIAHTMAQHREDQIDNLKQFELMEAQTKKVSK